MSDKYTTQSGREIKKAGRGDAAKGALAQLRAAREGGSKRTDQYQVSDVPFIIGKYDDEYDKIQDQRKNDDFIVDDDGYGYRDHGGEIWERDDHPEDGGKKKKRKLDPNEQSITAFMKPKSTINRPGAVTNSSAQIKQKPKVSAEQSKDIMNNLFQELDSKDVDELQDVNNSAVVTELNKPIAFNQNDMLTSKYAVTLETRQEVEQKRVTEQIQAQAQIGQNQQSSNPFSKKRKFEEIQNPNNYIRTQNAFFFFYLFLQFYAFLILCSKESQFFQFFRVNANKFPNNSQIKQSNQIFSEQEFIYYR